MHGLSIVICLRHEAGLCSVYCILRYTDFMSLRDITIDRLHHAYFLEGERNQMIAEVLGLLEVLSIPTRGNPDFHLHELDQFLLEHAHLLREKQQFHSVGGGRKIFLVAFNTILHEAQNALLKTLEEPTEGTHFFFTSRSQEVLLPTVRSRMNIIQLPVASCQLPEDAGEEFLAAGLPERMKMIEPMTKAKTDDKSEAKEGARDFLESLERALYQKMSRSDLDISHVLARVISAKRTLSERAPSLKLLLEHLALTVPQTGIKNKE